MPTRAGSTTYGDRATQLWIKTFVIHEIAFKRRFSAFSQVKNGGDFEGGPPS